MSHLTNALAMLRGRPRGPSRCANLRCATHLSEADYVELRDQNGRLVRLCTTCFDMPLSDLPECANAAIESTTNPTTL